MLGTADEIQAIAYDSDDKDHDVTLQQVLQICRHMNLKLNKDKCHFRCTSVPFLGEVVTREGVQPNPQMLKAVTEMHPPKTKKEFKAFLRIINYLGNISLLV